VCMHDSYQLPRSDRVQNPSEAKQACWQVPRCTFKLQAAITGSNVFLC
jgi:hypothetical protein